LSTAKVFLCRPQAALLLPTVSDITELGRTHLTLLLASHLVNGAAVAVRRSGLTDVLPRDQAARIVFHTCIGVPAARRCHCDAEASQYLDL
jgi:hypothetical protein